MNQKIQLNDDLEIDTSHNDLNFNIEINKDQAAGIASNQQQKQSIPAPPITTTQQQQQQQQPASFYDGFNLKQAGHPLACVFHILFKILALLSYFFLQWIDSNLSNIYVFIIVILFASFDFWTVKNVSGRLLVGLRWWTTILDDGSEKWEYESHDQEFQANSIDSSFFWTFQLGATVFWAILLFLKFISLSFFWFILCLTCFLLSYTNIQGFYNCNGAHQKKMRDLTQAGIQRVGIMGVQQFFRRG